MPDARFLNRVVLNDYRSIRYCDLPLPRFAVLVGPNGSGKSNFLDALRLVAEALLESLRYALLRRGGIGQVVRQPISLRKQFAIRIDCTLAHSDASYAFAVGTGAYGKYEVLREDCAVVSRRSPVDRVHYSIHRGRVASCSASNPPPATGDQLYLWRAADIPQFGPLYDSLSGMGFYRLNPESVRTLERHDEGTLLERDGSNLAKILFRIQRQTPETKRLIEDYLAHLVPGISGVDSCFAGPDLILEFRQKVGEDSDYQRFDATSISDGTLRVPGLLVALFQSLGKQDPNQGPHLIGIEEPENSVHPNALKILVDILRYAAEHAQVVVTSHSTDLLDRPDIAEDSIFTAATEGSESCIGPLSEKTRSVLRKRLSNPGELMRRNQLHLADRAGESKLPPSNIFDFVQ